MSEEELRKLEETINNYDNISILDIEFHGQYTTIDKLHGLAVRLSGICRQKYFSKLNGLLKSKHGDLSLIQPQYDILFDYSKRLNAIVEKINGLHDNIMYIDNTSRNVYSAGARENILTSTFSELKKISLELLGMARI